MKGVSGTVYLVMHDDGDANIALETKEGSYEDFHLNGIVAAFQEENDIAAIERLASIFENHASRIRFRLARLTMLPPESCR